MAKKTTANGAATETTDEQERRRLNWKDLATMVGMIVLLSGLMMSIVAWVHAESTIPKILNRTADQIEKALEKHISTTQAVPRTEFELLKNDLKDDLHKVEQAVVGLKTDTKDRLNRIEEKLDRM